MRQRTSADEVAKRVDGPVALDVVDQVETGIGDCAQEVATPFSRIAVA